MSAFDVEVIGTDQVVEISGSGEQEIDVEAGVSVTGGRDYNDLFNKPRIESVELVGDKTLEDIGITSPTNAEIAALFR